MSLLTIRGVSKRFGSVQALGDIHLEFHAGEIHCLLGENGAGKSTLMHVLNGVLRPDSGTLLVDGEAVELTSPRAARAVGIGMVHQHFTLIDAMSVGENLALSVSEALDPGVESSPTWRFDRLRIAEFARAFAERVGLDLPPPDEIVRDLSVGARQRLEILKALIAAGKILILDEPTAVLTPGEVDQLFVMLRELRAQNRLVLFITHKLREVKEIADRVTILRRGRVVATHVVADIDEARMANDMIGTDLPSPPDAVGSVSDEVMVEMRNVSCPGGEGDSPLIDLNLGVRAGEIVGVAGVDGNGQRELFELLVGLRRPRSGFLGVAGQDGAASTPQGAHAAGIAAIPPDRHREGLALSMSVAENFLLSSSVLEVMAPNGWLDRVAARRFAEETSRSYSIRFGDLDQPVQSLSGGNQQRLVVGRELSQHPKVVVAASPTRGLDVKAAQTVAEALRAAAASGCAIVLISTDLDELLELSHRIVVLFRGRLSPPLPRPFDTTLLGRWMAGELA